MSRKPRRFATFALLTVATIVFGACAGAGATPSAAAPTAAPTTAPTAAPTAAPSSAAPSVAPSSAAPASAAPSASQTALSVYPAEGQVDCAKGEYNGLALTGGLKEVKAIDPLTVQFTLCKPDVAFLSKVAFSAMQINDSDYLQTTGGGGDALTKKPNGTGPYKLVEFSDTQVVLERNPDYWGEAAKAPRVVIRWNGEPAQRLQALQSGEADGIDLVAKDAFPSVEADATLKLIPRAALNVTYLGFNNKFAPFDNEKVRQAFALAINKKRIVDNFYPAASTEGDYFTPCDILGGCEGDPFPKFDAAAAKALLAEAGVAPGTEVTLYYRAKPRSYINDPTAVATDLKDQLETNLGIKVKLSAEEDATYLTNASKGEKYGLFLLGWGADYPDQTNFLDYHFGPGSNSQFGTKWDDLIGVLNKASATAVEAERKTLYAEANGILKTHIPMIPLAHGGSATAWKADVTGAHSSPLSNEALYVMAPGTRDQLVWVQNGPPSGLYCGDETDGEALRVCEQIGEGLYTYEVGGTKANPALAESCDPSTDLTVWTCKLRPGVKFHNGATLDANDVVVSFGAMWDLNNPLHKGRTGAGTFDYFGAFWGFLNVKPA